MTYSFRTPKGAEITTQSVDDGMRITAKVGGRIALDQTVTYLTFCSVENADRTAKALKVGEAFIEVSQGQREAITSDPVLRLRLSRTPRLYDLLKGARHA